jgi:hypothetical protein
MSARKNFLGMSSGGDADAYETVLTTWLNRGIDGDPRKRTAQEFPLRLAATMRTILEAQSS